MNKSTLLLKIAVILISLPALGLALFLWFTIGNQALTAATLGETLGYIISAILLALTFSLIPYFFALIQAFKILTYIDNAQAFSNLSVIALRKIKQSAFTISGIYVIISPLVYVVAEWDDAPGLILIALIPLFASLVIAVFSALLQNLLNKAIEIKDENQLTI